MGDSKLKKLVFLSTYQLADTRAFSGSNRRMFLSFQKLVGYQVDYKMVGPDPIVRFVIRAYGKIFRAITKRSFQTGLEERYSPSICRRALSYLKKHDYDGVICWQLVFGNLYKKYVGKKVFFSDATYHKEVSYYGWKVDANQFARNDQLQSELLHFSDLIMLSNHYFDDDISNYYGIPLAHVRYFRFFPTLSGSYDAKKKRVHELNAIIVAQNYYDKGIPIAIKTIELLNLMGIDTFLTVVGFENIEHLDNPYVRFAGRVPQEGVRNLGSLFAEADIFLLPTHHDCSPLVIPEANSFSLPVIAYRTGGIPDYVEDGVTGYLLPEGSPADSFADVIYRHIKRYGSFKNMGRNSKEHQSALMSENTFVSQTKLYFDEVFVP